MIAALPPAWQGDLSKIQTPPQVHDGDFGAFQKLGPGLGKGLRGEVAYALRDKEYLRDVKRYDDVLVIDFDGAQIDFAELTQKVFPALVEGFDAYRAAVKDDTQCLEDWPRIAALAKETERDVDGRDTVFRIHAVNYFDKELCKRAFDMTPSELLQKLGSVFNRAELFQEGVLLVCTKAFPDADELRRIEEAFRKELAQATESDPAAAR